VVDSWMLEWRCPRYISGFSAILGVLPVGGLALPVEVVPVWTVFWVAEGPTGRGIVLPVEESTCGFGGLSGWVSTGRVKCPTGRRTVFGKVWDYITGHLTHVLGFIFMII
jgi:hypothetical protein